MEGDQMDEIQTHASAGVLGIFIGYAGFHRRKNFSMAIPELTLLGFDQSELSIVSMNAVAYACPNS